MTVSTMLLKTALYLYIISILGVSDVYTQPCSNGFHPYTNGLSCIQFEVDQSLNYSSALLLQTAQNNNYGLAEAITTIDLRTLSTYAASILADNSSYTPLWVSDSNVNGNMMDCPALLNETIELLNCSLELGYIVQISYNIQNVSRITQDPLYLPPDGFLLEIPYPFNYLNYPIEWTFNDTNLDPTIIVLPDNSLRFPNFNEDLVGVYKAFTNNGFNHALVFAIDLQQAVFFEPSPPNNITIPGGHLAVFECSSQNSRPIPNIIWYNSANLSITTGGRYLVSPLGSLYIREVATGDSGTYYCSVGNTVGIAFLSAQLEVINRTIDGETIQARFIQSPRNQTVLEDEAATLECTSVFNHVITDNRISSVTTYLYEANGLFVNTVIYNPSFVGIFPSVQYQINTAPVEVRCQAQITVSSLGISSISSDYAKITPNARAAIINIFPDSYVSIGDSILLTCSFHGIPTPRGQWYFNGYPYNETSSNGNFIMINIDKFSINNIGTYQCVVVNRHSVAAAPVVLFAKDGRPGAVNASVLLVNETSLKVTWSPLATTNTISPILIRYVITWHIVGLQRSSMETITLPHTEFSHVIQGLQMGSVYEVRVSAISSHLKGPVVFHKITIPQPQTTSLIVSQVTSTTTILATRSKYSTSKTSDIITKTITPSIGGVGSSSSMEVTPLYVLGSILFVGVLVIFLIIGSTIAVYTYWKNKEWTKGNYSPSKIEEVNQRDAMLSVEPKPISPFSPLTPLSTGIPATNHTMAVTRNRTSDAGSTGSVEVIRVDRLYTSQDVLCTPDNVIYDRIQKKQEFFPPDDYNKCTCN